MIYFETLYNTEPFKLLLSLNAIASSTAEAYREFAARGSQPIAGSIPDVSVVYAPDVPSGSIMRDIERTEVGEFLKELKLPLHYVIHYAGQMVSEERIHTVAATSGISDLVAAERMLDHATIQLAVNEISFQANVARPTVDDTHTFVADVMELAAMKLGLPPIDP